MTNKGLLVPGLLVAASAALLIGMFVYFGPKGASEKSTATPASALAQSGVRPAEQDSARRELSSDQALGEDEAAPAPAVAPIAAPPVDEERMRPVPPPEPPPPVVLSEEEQAAQDAYYALRDRVGEDARRALDKQTSGLKKACWKPELAGAATQGIFSINANFDATGKLVASGISDVRGSDAPGAVSECLRQQPIALKVPPPGQAMTVEVPLRLP